jgi:twinkle protein
MESFEDSGSKRYTRISGATSTLYRTILHNIATQVLLVSGEIDCLSVIQGLISSGYTLTDIRALPFEVMAPPTGEAELTAEVAAELDYAEDIVIAYDNDPQGKQGAIATATRLGRHRCRIAQWPDGCNDANDALCKDQLDLFTVEGMLANATSLAATSVKTAASLADDVVAWLFGGAPATGWSTGWRNLDSLIGGFRAGESTLVTGHSGGGKTTFACQAALYQAIEGKRRVLLCPFEGGARHILPKLVRQLTG